MNRCVTFNSYSLISVWLLEGNGRFSDLRSTAAVNAGLTGSVDRVSLWQHCVYVDTSQKTLGDLVERNGFVVHP